MHSYISFPSKYLFEYLLRNICIKQWVYLLIFFIHDLNRYISKQSLMFTKLSCLYQFYKYVYCYFWCEEYLSTFLVFGHCFTCFCEIEFINHKKTKTWIFNGYITKSMVLINSFGIWSYQDQILLQIKCLSTIHLWKYLKEAC